jgi:hypothetical protein
MADDTCRYMIDERYIHRAFNNFRMGYLYYLNDMPWAFCIWSIRGHTNKNRRSEKVLYIHLICTKESNIKFLHIILYDIEQYCIQNNINTIILEPVNDDVRSYYRKYGFININDKLMSKNSKNISYILNMNKTRRSKHKNISHTRKRIKNISTNFSNLNNHNINNI